MGDGLVLLLMALLTLTPSICYFSTKETASVFSQHQPAHLGLSASDGLRPSNELSDRGILLLSAVNRFDRQTARPLAGGRPLAGHPFITSCIPRGHGHLSIFIL